MNRAKKREEASYHDSRRWLKYHEPRRSNPLFGLSGKIVWYEAVKRTIALYPKLAAQQRADMAAGGLRTHRRGPSAEDVVIRHSWGPVVAVEMAFEQFSRSDQERLKIILWSGARRVKEDRAKLNLFYRYLAVYLGYGRQRYDCKSS